MKRTNEKGKGKSSEDLKNANNAIWRLLKVRLRSERELRDRLKKKNIPDPVIDQAISYFKQLGLINDRQFTQKWISSRLHKPFGFSRIQFELKTKGIQDEIIKDELSEAFEHFSEQETVLNLAKRQAAKYKNVSQKKIKQRLYGYLIRRGFSQKKILKAIKEIDHTNENNDG